MSETFASIEWAGWKLSERGACANKVFFDGDRAYSVQIDLIGRARIGRVDNAQYVWLHFASAEQARIAIVLLFAAMRRAR